MEGGGWLLLIIDLLGAAFLAAALIYGIFMWRRRPKSPADERAREEAVRGNYRRGG
jgi:threonine/homoserine/homoserine lactone efflux protein